MKDVNVTDLNNGLNSLTISTNGLSKGVYTVKLAFRGKVLVERFVKGGID
ncbi:MAG: hypothetical protein ABEH43_05060 [Flavobacteriales bacterium]